MFNGVPGYDFMNNDFLNNTEDIKTSIYSFVGLRENRIVLGGKTHHRDKTDL